MAIAYEALYMCCTSHVAPRSRVFTTRHARPAVSDRHPLPRNFRSPERNSRESDSGSLYTIHFHCNHYSIALPNTTEERQRKETDLSRRCSLKNAPKSPEDI